MSTLSSDQIFIPGMRLNTPYDITVSNVTKLPTDIWGLKYRPTLEPVLSDDQDSPGFGSPGAREEVSDCNIAVVKETVKDMGDGLKAILEIGVNRNGERSMSRILMDDRPKDSFYLGVDLDDKSYLDDPDHNTWTLRCDSHDQVKVREFLSSKRVDKIDLLFIDGWHSVNACVNDWRYADLLSDHGVVIMHDTNGHPGPITLFEAVDERLFVKVRHCLDYDHGIGVCKRR